MSEFTGYITPRDVQAEGARKHYEELSTEASSWYSVIPEAINAWEREPALLTRALEAERELKELRERTRWIPVSERLPKLRGSYDVIVSQPFSKKYERIVTTRYYWPHLGANGWGNSKNVTHWKERPTLPVPPEAEND